MADPPPFPDGDDIDAEPDSAPGRTAWVSVLGIATVAILVVVVALLHLFGVVGPGAH
jgi:hypothetical protein